MASIKQLLGIDVATLEAMDDATLKKHCEPYIKIVQLEAKEEGSSASGIVDLESGVGNIAPRRKRVVKKDNGGTSLQQQMEALAKQYGVDLSGSKLPGGLK